MISLTFNLYSTATNEKWGNGTISFQRELFGEPGSLTVEGPISYNGPVSGRPTKCGDSPASYEFSGEPGGTLVNLTLIHNPFESRASFAGSMTLNSREAVLNLTAVEA